MAPNTRDNPNLSPSEQTDDNDQDTGNLQSQNADPNSSQYTTNPVNYPYTMGPNLNFSTQPSQMHGSPSDSFGHVPRGYNMILPQNSMVQGGSRRTASGRLINHNFNDHTMAEALSTRDPVESPFGDQDGGDGDDLEQYEDDDDEDEYIEEAPKSKSKSKGKAIAVNVSASIKKATPAAKAAAKRWNDRLVAGQRNAKEMDERSGLYNQGRWENEEYDPPSDLENGDVENGEDDPNQGDWEDDTPSKRNKNSKKQSDVYIPPGMALTRNGQIVAANGRVKGRKLVLWHRPRMIEKLMLHMWYELHRRGVEIPWNAIVHRLSPGSSGQSATQHLNKLRDTLVAEGHMVPPLCGKVSHRNDPDIRGMIRDMSQKDVSAVRNVLWDELIEDRKENLVNPGVIRGSGNYRKNPGGQGLDKLVKPKDGTRRSRNPQPEGQAPTTRSSRKRAAVEEEPEDDGTEVRLEDVEKPTPSKKHQSATRTLRTRQTSQSMAEARSTPSRPRESQMITLNGFSQGSLNNYPHGESGTIGAEFDEDFKQEKQSTPSEDDGSVYQDDSPSVPRSTQRPSGGSSQPQTVGASRFQNMNLDSPIPPINFGRPTPRSNPRPNTSRQETQRLNQEFRDRGYAAMQARMATPGRNPLNADFDPHGSFRGLADAVGMNGLPPSLNMAMPMQPAMYGGNPGSGHGHPMMMAGRGMIPNPMLMNMPAYNGAYAGYPNYNPGMVNGSMMQQHPGAMPPRPQQPVGNTVIPAARPPPGVVEVIGAAQQGQNGHPENQAVADQNEYVENSAPEAAGDSMTLYLGTSSINANDPFGMNNHDQGGNSARELMENEQQHQQNNSQVDEDHKVDFNAIHHNNRNPDDYDSDGSWTGGGFSGQFGGSY